MFARLFGYSLDEIPDMTIGGHWPILTTTIVNKLFPIGIEKVKKPRTPHLNMGRWKG